MRRAVLLCTLIAALASAPAAPAADFTWTGGDGNWSNGGSWAGGVAPSGTVGTLIFPATACPSACPYVNDDVSGLTAATISIRGKRGQPRPWIFGTDVTPVPLTLTTGLDAGFPDAGSVNDGAAHLSLPIVLGADNTWTVDAAKLSAGQDFGITGNHALLLNLTNGGSFRTSGRTIEIGPVTVAGGGTLDFGQAPGTGPGQPPGQAGSLNGSNGNPVTVSGATLQTSGAVAVGALTATQATIRPNSGTLTTKAVSLDAASRLILQGGGIDQATSTDTDHSRLTSSGAVDLGGAGLTVYPTSGNCAQADGTAFTLVSTTGTLNGTFAGLPDGAVLPSPGPGASAPCGSSAKAMRINYHPADMPRTVTATLQPAPAATPPPKVTVTATPTPTPPPGYGPAAAAEGKKISKTLSALPLPKKSNGKQAKFVIPANALPPGTRLRLALLAADGLQKVGAKEVTIKGGAPTTVRVPLSKRARKQLRKKGKLKLKLFAFAMIPSGSKGSSTRKLTLKKK